MGARIVAPKVRHSIAQGAAQRNPANWPGPNSNHPGVVLAVFADGHSTTIQDRVSFAVWASINTRAGGESINGDF
jgi:hypothetical protein